MILLFPVFNFYRQCVTFTWTMYPTRTVIWRKLDCLLLPKYLFCLQSLPELNRSNAVLLNP